MAKYSRQRKWYWGHGNAEAIHPREYARERDLISSIVHQFINDPHIQAGLELIERWIEVAGQEIYCRYSFELVRLRDAGIKPVDILIEAAAIWLFCHTQPGRVLSENHREHLVGNRILRLKPYWGHTTGPQHRDVGRFLARRLKPIFRRLILTVDARFKDLESRKAKMSVPLEI